MFTGSLRSFPLVGEPIIANILVQVARSAPSDNSNETWSVRRIALADTEDDKSPPYFQSLNWPAITSLLPCYPRLEHFQVLCGEEHAAEDFRVLSDKVMEAVNHHRAVTIEHGPELPDGRFLEPMLFGLTERDLARTRQSKV
ncbi:uncharacterized protein PHACADRAFT_259181 [Phanerochaete carnosa HHB-10118-sp]|uniref:Uncharacterized protein n=1 Tax=Phanerochaete carnosa (strain HHB-10118-sp) TaxID=650164 RepID=K5VNG8_PHACS|nr:uncharacterized protein PHACADRAFT_259181 [Phanerochaete carnosa HHB-10118-sp]EKM53008.1 hypothetical protein PHACADRAFT_259181 [Phanerochaete carnosa HHB-10118-sp]